MKEIFELGGEEFEADITEYKNKKIEYFGKYKIVVRNEKNKIVAGIQPAETFLNGIKYPHKALFVSSDYREKGLASWLFEKTRRLGDILEYECVPLGVGLDQFYLRKGYEVIKEIKDETGGHVFRLLKLKK